MTTPHDQLISELHKIVTYHKDDGWSGYLISDEQIEAILAAVAESTSKELGNVENPNQEHVTQEGWVGIETRNNIRERLSNLLKGGQ